jgi:hypothetical protein
MRLLAILAVHGAVGVGVAISANGLPVWAPGGWHRIAPAGVIVGWKGANGDTGVGTKELARLRAVKRSVFQCFKGRGAAATVVLRQCEYQVNVMVGDRATKRRIGEALDVARSFALKG